MASGAGIVVVGGGWAGVSCAVALAHAGTPVTLLEERSRLGGRAYSFRDPATGDEVDNGQHLFMGCFEEGLRFLRRIGTERGIVFQENLHVPVLDAGGRRTALRCPRLPAPLHLLAGILRHSGLAPADRLGIIRSWSAVRGRSKVLAGRAPDGDRSDPTVEEWLDDLGQTAGSRRIFWRPLAVAALNEDSRRASSRLFRVVLREGMMGGRAGSRLGFPRVPLSRLIDPAREFLERRGGRVILNAGVTRLVLENGKIGKVRLRDGSEIAASDLVCAIPPAALRRILPESISENDSGFAGLRRFESSPILTVHLWYDREVLDSPFVGLLDSPVHWIFRRDGEGDPARPGSRLTLVTSSARELVDQPAAELASMAAAEVRRFLPHSSLARLTQTRVIKERQATFASVAGVESWRPPHRTSIPNLFLAGDWTGTGLPGTLESAARSGHRCAAFLRPGADRAA